MAEESPGVTPVLGANLNGRPRRLDGAMELIGASGTRRVRAFLDVRRIIEAGGDPREDPDVVALRRVAREAGCSLIVSLKWDFRANWGDKAPMNVPPQGSDAEAELFRTAARCLEHLGDAVDVVVLGNEPMWETLAEDVKVAEPPVVRFTRSAKDYLVDSAGLTNPTYLVGAFNRGHDDRLREREFPHFYEATAEFVREDPDVDGVDLHVHFDAFSEAEAMVANARELFPEEVITVTEFSPVFRYARNVERPIDTWPAGEAFARDHGLPGSTTAVEYFERAKREPRPAEELADFYEAMPWYDVDHLERMYRLFDAHDVGIGTFGFLAGFGMRNEDWTRRWTPFHINFLFQPALLDASDGVEHAANLHYLEDYRRLAG